MGADLEFDVVCGIFRGGRGAGVGDGEGVEFGEEHLGDPDVDVLAGSPAEGDVFDDYSGYSTWRWMEFCLVTKSSVRNDSDVAIEQPDQADDSVKSQEANGEPYEVHSVGRYMSVK